MNEEVDRLDAEALADFLGIDAAAIPEDQETLTAALWEVVGLGSELLPVSVEDRWELLAPALLMAKSFGGVFGWA